MDTPDETTADGSVAGDDPVDESLADDSTDESADSDPTEESADDAGPECPFCGSTDTEVESAFGSEVSKTQYYCHGCTTVFERIKFDGDLPDTGR